MASSFLLSEDTSQLSKDIRFSCWDCKGYEAAAQGPRDRISGEFYFLIPIEIKGI